MNFQAIAAIYTFEMARFFRTLKQSFISPVLSTSLYFVVFGTAIGSRMEAVDGVAYGAFIVPGLIMLSVRSVAQISALCQEAGFVDIKAPKAPRPFITSAVTARKSR